MMKGLAPIGDNPTAKCIWESAVTLNWALSHYMMTYLMSMLGLSLLQNVQTRSRAHTVSYSMGTGTLSQGLMNWGIMLTTHLHLMPRLELVEIYLHYL
jgi:multisubunit Na+/H+ antiporter MnhG subunit